ncbi:MAG: hypothetical protein AAF604_16205 [Acidobacteriota bacterium]
MTHASEWLAPAPLWDRTLPSADESIGDTNGGDRFRQPTLLRFDSDSFLEDLMALLGEQPAEVAEHVARPETWETPSAGWADHDDASLGELLKLFQPAHGRFYLLAASLVCRRAGLPDRRVDPAEEDKACWVMRRLVPRPGRDLDPDDATSFDEQAWIGDRSGGRWQSLAASALEDLTEGEEELPLFALPFELEGGKRRLWAGLVPVAGRELYETAAPAAPAAEAAAAEPPAAPTDPLAELDDPRKAELAAGPLQSLGILTGLDDDIPSAAARESLRFLLLDFADAFVRLLPDLAAAIRSASPADLDTPQLAVWNCLGAVIPGGVTWRESIRRADAQRDVLLGLREPEPTDPEIIPPALSRAQIEATAVAVVHGGELRDRLFASIDARPQPADDTPGRAPSAAARAVAASAEADGSLYRARCVYRRPRCRRFTPPTVSRPTRPFRLAPFFDPEAPTRPLTIRMPLDTSLKGLRKFPKGVAVLMSNKLRQQVEQVQAATVSELEEGVSPNEPSWSLGMICSLSIPIITLVAFILLQIFVQLLNIIFWWLPFFKICLPIPVRNDS